MFGALSLLVLAGLAGPLLAATRRPLLPVLVGELAAGALLGRTGLHWLDPSAPYLQAIQTLGFAMLMLQAGNEVDILAPDLRQGIVRGGIAVLVAAVVAVPAGLGVAAATGGAANPTLLIVLLAGSSAAVAFPTIQEQKLTGPLVAMLMGWIALADAATALLMPLTLTGAGQVPFALAGDALIVIAAAFTLLTIRRAFATRPADTLKHMSKDRRWALQLRLALLLLLALAAISERFRASLLMAGFAAGIVLRQFHQPHRLENQLLGLANGFLVPAFFVLLGANLDLRGLVASPSAIGLALAMAVGATAVHLAGAFAAGRRPRVPAGLVASAQLGLPAAAASLGLATRTISPPVAAALVAGGVLTLVPATLGAYLLARTAPPPSTGDANG